VKLGWINAAHFICGHGITTPRARLKIVSAFAETSVTKENNCWAVVDLARNGGGSLEEVISLTGFVFEIGADLCKPKARMEHWASRAIRTPGIAYSGPLVVLTHRQSASASEIFAAARQDYGDARWSSAINANFGKEPCRRFSTSQLYTSLLGSRSHKDGALKLTTEFYRVCRRLNTASTGVASDLVPFVAD